MITDTRGLSPAVMSAIATLEVAALDVRSASNGGHVESVFRALAEAAAHLRAIRA